VERTTRAPPGPAVGEGLGTKHVHDEMTISGDFMEGLKLIKRPNGWYLS